jgi:hypothetical protein
VTPLERADCVCALLRGYRFSSTGEAELQRGIDKVLTDAGLQVQREKHLSRKDRPDFLVQDGVAIEVKIDGSLTAVMRQISRYATQPAVLAIILVTTRATHAVRMPESFCGKPVRVVHLAGALG